MDIDRLENLLVLLKKFGVTHYKDNDIELTITREILYNIPEESNPPPTSKRDEYLKNLLYSSGLPDESIEEIITKS